MNVIISVLLNKALPCSTTQLHVYYHFGSFVILQTIELHHQPKLAITSISNINVSDQFRTNLVFNINALSGEPEDNYLQDISRLMTKIVSYISGHSASLGDNAISFGSLGNSTVA